MEVATDVAAHAALMGFSVQLFETVGWAEELLEAATAADVRRLPRLYTAAGYACFAGRAEAARAHAHRATELETDSRYDACEPGYASFIEALCEVYCGNLDRYVELTGTGVHRYGRERGYGLASYVDGLQSSGRVNEAARPWWRSRSRPPGSSAIRTGSPTLCGSSDWPSPRPMRSVHSRPGTRASRSCESTASSSSRASSLVTQLGCTLLTESPRPRWCFSPKPSTAFHRAGNVPQLIITLASLPALFERLDRPEPAATLLAAMSREPSSAHHVPELSDLGNRLTRRLGAKRTEELSLAGASLDLDDAALYAQRQIDLARRSPIPRPERPGGLSRREVEVLRLVADGRTAREIAAQLFISSRTAEHHIQHVYTKIGVSGRAAATRWAMNHSVVDAAAR